VEIFMAVLAVLAVAELLLLTKVVLALQGKDFLVAVDVLTHSLVVAGAVQDLLVQMLRVQVVLVV
jgi:hypothetical protein